MLHYASLALAAAVVFAVVVFFSFVLLRLRAVPMNQIAVEEMRVLISELQKRQEELRTNLNDRLGELEFTVYGTLEPQSKEAPRPRASEPSWSRNRDAELRKSIQSLQRRLAELENARQQP